jgi:hypothetical protein
VTRRRQSIGVCLRTGTHGENPRFDDGRLRALHERVDAGEVEALSTSRTVAMSKPTEVANATASLVAASAVAAGAPRRGGAVRLADRKLLAGLSA